MVSRSLVIGFLLVMGMHGSAQFSNSWIQPNQQYFKIMIAEDGWYRVTNTELVNAGVPLSTINSSRIQLFRRGVEVAIRREASGGLLSAFQFYGQKNDGAFDTQLYQDPTHQPNVDYSLFSDSAAYFLTWSATATGKEIAVNTNQNKTVAKEAYFLDRLSISQTFVYSEGQKYGPQNELSSGAFAAGEGWTGQAFQKTGSQTFTFDLTDKVVTGSKPSLNIVLVGANNQQHNAELSVGPDVSNQRVIGNATFLGYNTTNFASSFEWSDVGADNRVVVVVKAVGYSGIAENISVSKVDIEYPRLFSLAGTNEDFYALQSTTNDRYFINIPTTIAATTQVYALTDPSAPVRHTVAAFSDRMEVVLGSEVTDFIAVSSPRSVPSIRKAITTYLNPNGANYLIISHPLLRLSASNGLDQIQAYEDYRKSALGGQFNVYTASILEIYDQFGYGDRSPIALRNYFEFALSKGVVDYGLLIGKGLNLAYAPYRNNALGIPYYIPTFGYPGSDAMFAAHIGGDPVSKFPVGRINASSPEEIKTYLEKVKEMESLPFTALWRKNLLHLSGGQNNGELSIFYGNILGFKRVAEGDFYGGKVSLKRKESANPVESINVTQLVNNGLSMITFFGHSGSFTQDVEIGNPRKDGNPNGFNNTGKYPVMLMNGCNSGSIFDSNDSYIDDWVKAPRLGAIAGVAHVDFASSANLKRFSDLFYSVAFSRDATFGASVGQICQQVHVEYFSIFGINEISESQLYGMLLIGDPAVKIFGASKPDYAITSSDVYTSSSNEERPLSTSASFPVYLVVKNYGRTVSDSLKIKIDRTLPDGKIISYLKSFDHPKYQDTLRFEIENIPGNKYDGQNLLAITLDPENLADELNEANNQVFFNLFLAKGNTLNLFPTDLGIASDPQVKFTFQSVDFLSNERLYSLEIDTMSSFSSTYFKTISLTGEVLLEYQLDASDIPDSTVMYWRTRYAAPKAGEDTSWVSSSFTLIRGSQKGWMIRSTSQFGSLEAAGINLNPSTGQWSFNTSQSDFQIIVHGSDTPGNYTYEDFHVIINSNDLLITDLGPNANPFCRENVMGALFLDKQSSLPFSPLGLIDDEINNPLVCGQQPQLLFNMDENDILGTHRYLDSLISLLEPGDGMVLFSFGEVIYSNWDAQVISSLAQIGIRSTTISSLVDGQPAVFFGRKGASQGEAIEIISNGTGVPLPDQQLDFKGTFNGTYSIGYLNTSRIGPAKRWESFSYEVEESGQDQTTFIVYGVNQTGTKEALFTENRIGQIDISTVDALTYPFLQLEIVAQDPLARTPPVLQKLAFLFEQVPEGLLVAPDKTTTELPEGKEFKRDFYYINVSDQPFEDSVSVTFTLTQTTSGNSSVSQFKKMGTASGDTIVFQAVFPTVGKTGTNRLNVQVIPEELELNALNNALILSPALNVTKDEVNPALDVTFDGSYILNGDIVSPNTQVKIRIKDTNPYLLKQDTGGLSIAIKRPCETCIYERVPFTDPKLTYTPASQDGDFEILYQPGPLENGDYGLKVQGSDVSGNTSGTDPFEIEFKVINESTVTHFFPYPNPFSTSTRFVFTLTGSELPDQIKIQIMTVTGRVVREITQDEIGPLKIGQNISDYAWDGHDEYGDQLANGVYLYKVFIRQAGERVDHRFTSADRAFKHGFGKIYLLK